MSNLWSEILKELGEKFFWKDLKGSFTIGPFRVEMEKTRT